METDIGNPIDYNPNDYEDDMKNHDNRESINDQENNEKRKRRSSHIIHFRGPLASFGPLWCSFGCFGEQKQGRPKGSRGTQCT